MSKYEVFISYRVRTDQENAKIIYTEFRFDQSKNTRVFWDSAELKIGTNYKKQFLDALVHSRVFMPIISNIFIEELNVSEGMVDNVLLEWDKILECCENGSGQLVVPIFVEDETGAFDFAKAGRVMTDFTAKDCKRSAKQIWDAFSLSQGIKVDLRISSNVKLLVHDVRERISAQPLIKPFRKRFDFSDVFSRLLRPSPLSPPVIPTQSQTQMGPSSNQKPVTPPQNTAPVTLLANNRPLQFNLYEKNDPEICIDCTKVMREIEEIFKSSNICNLKGLGGSGKTFVANKCAFLMLAKGYIIAKFTADNVANLTKDFADYLTILLKVDKLPITSGKVCDYLQLLNNSNLPKQLIILDNVKLYADIEDFRHSKNSNVKILITSRTFITHPAITKDFYSEDACIEYLKKETNRGFTDVQCKLVFDATNGFPLRLALAAGTLRDPTEPLEDYLTAVEKKKSLMNFVFDPEKDATDEFNELFPEVSLSIDKLTKKVSFRYLALLAYVEPDLIVEKYLVASVDDYKAKSGTKNDMLPLDAAQIETSRKAALKLGIVELVNSLSTLKNKSSSSIAIKIHRCVQAEIQDRVKRQANFGTAALEIAKLYDARTKSYDTLCSELRAGKVNDAAILLQKWSSCTLGGK